MNPPAADKKYEATFWEASLYSRETLLKFRIPVSTIKKSGGKIIVKSCEPPPWCQSITYGWYMSEDGCYWHFSLFRKIRSLQEVAVEITDDEAILEEDC